MLGVCFRSKSYIKPFTLNRGLNGNRDISLSIIPISLLLNLQHHMADLEPQQANHLPGPANPCSRPDLLQRQNHALHDVGVSLSRHYTFLLACAHRSMCDAP
jgi:hypothetical protein